MKIMCTKSNLLQGVNVALKAVSTKTTLPILECILLEANNQAITLTSNDMELGIETTIDCSVQEPGKIALNAKLFSEIVRKLPDNDITIQTNNSHQAIIVCEKSKFTISGQAGDDFPLLPEIERLQSITISQFMLKEVIRQTIFSISDNENAKLMTGELFDISENNLRVVSLDGHRISIRNIELKDRYENIKVVVPGKTLSDLSKILNDKETELRNILQEEINLIFKTIYEGGLSLDIDKNYGIKVQADTYETETSTAQSISVIFAFISGIIKLAREYQNNENKELASEPYPLVMDAPLSAFDKHRIKKVCEVLPEIAEQVIIFIKDTDGDLAKENLKNKIGKMYNLEKINEFNTVVR